MRIATISHTYDERFALLNPRRDTGSTFLFKALNQPYIPLGTDANSLCHQLSDLTGAERKFSSASLSFSKTILDQRQRGTGHTPRATERGNTSSKTYTPFVRQRMYVGSVTHVLPRDWHNHTNLQDDPDEHHRRNEAIKDSFSRKSEIWFKGGRGWWSPDDESRVDWPPRVVEKKEPDRSFTKKDQFITEMKAWREDFK